MSIQERCRTIRTQVGLSARGMSARLGLGNSMWTHYELGQREPGLESCRRLYAMGISLDWFISGDGEMWREGSAHSLAPTDSPQPELERILNAFEQVLDSYHLGRLQVWTAIVDALEKNAPGLTWKALLSRLPFPIEESLLHAELAQLETEGIVSSPRGVIRLIRASMDYHGADSKLYMLNAIKDLLRWHLPRENGQIRKWKLMQLSVMVDSGQGVVRARDLMKRVLDGLTSLQESKRPSGTERIDVMTSIAVTLDMETPNGTE